MERAKIIKSSNEIMPFCNEGGCIHNHEFTCIIPITQEELHSSRITQGNKDGQWCACCPVFEKGVNMFYEYDKINL